MSTMQVVALPEPYERLRDDIHYEPTTGVFTWSRHRGPVRPGDVAGSMLGDYWSVRYAKKTILAHRLAVLYMTGQFPESPLAVDHLDGNKLNNAWSNLRVVSPRTNNQNLKRARHGSKSGLLGAHWNSQEQKWQAAIRINGRVKHLGRFNTPEEAHATYVIAKRKFHDGCTI